MSRLKGGKSLLDLTSLGDLDLEPSLSSEQFDIIKKLCGFNEINETFIDLPKPILCKCNLKTYIVYIEFNILSDDNSEIYGHVILSDNIEKLTITSEGNITLYEISLG